MSTFKEFYVKGKKEVRIGVVGFSEKKFDNKKATEYIVDAFAKIRDDNKDCNFAVVSGWTNLGIPAIAYDIALYRLAWKCVGIASEKAKDFDCFPCHEVKIVGKEWGDESEALLNDITVLVKVGGGKQSQKEFEKAKEMGIKTYVYELEEEKENV